MMITFFLLLLQVKHKEEKKITRNKLEEEKKRHGIKLIIFLELGDKIQRGKERFPFFILLGVLFSN